MIIKYLRLSNYNYNEKHRKFQLVFELQDHTSLIITATTMAKHCIFNYLQNLLNIPILIFHRLPYTLVIIEICGEMAEWSKALAC